MAKVIKNINLANNIYKLKLKGEFKGAPGQFYMLKSENTFLNRPLSINDKDKDSITFLFEKKGSGTSYISNLKEGMEIDLFGPYGNGFDLDYITKTNKDISLIGGGIGVAPLYYLIKTLKENNFKKKIITHLGFREEAYELHEFKKLSDEFILDIGGIINKKVDFTKDNLYITCGPSVMMKNACEILSGSNKEILVSLESKMACGIGACLGCNIKTKNGNKKVCSDGPVFFGAEVFFCE